MTFEDILHFLRVSFQGFFFEIGSKMNELEGKKLKSLSPRIMISQSLGVLGEI